MWGFDCSSGVTFWIDKYAYIEDQPFGDQVRFPAVTDNKGIMTLEFAESEDLNAPVINDVEVTWVATDFASNTNSCVIEVRVKRKQVLCKFTVLFIVLYRLDK